MMKANRPATTVISLTVALAVAAVPVDVSWRASAPSVSLASADAKNGNGGGRGDKGGSDSKGSKGQNGSNGKAKGRAASVAKKEVTPNSIAVRYRNGYLEQVVKGRFIMKDSRGRTIVNRKATAQDRMRLWLKTIVP
ncbi:hypothetical protein [Sinorhizobium sp. RAC02]|uniref:hypothetical protein n=1 Tax=Sinorhizobium sp. RAC02 TaxID=1842534 RepID=UPI00083CE10E|nr:hypothetical protein [Sinorhizobium sp. RAC02]AOF93206.1 hypothetical protein BSY16_4211 [Sinorhizobium sp. RAC02]